MRSLTVAGLIAVATWSTVSSCEGPNPVPSPPAGAETVPGTPIGPEGGRTVTLHFLDAATGSPLTYVELLKAGATWPTSRLPHPGEVPVEELIVSGGSSPIELKVPEREPLPIDAFWVRTAGHAWQRIEVDYTREEHRVNLVAGGNMRIETLELPPTPAPLWLRLRTSEDDSERPFTQLPFTKAAFLIESLPPGDYLVHAEIGEFGEDAVRLGTARVTVRAGEETAVDLPLTAPPEPPARIRVRGALLVHPSWAEDCAPAIIVKPVKVSPLTPQDVIIRRGPDLVAHEHDRHSLQWSPGELPPGTYRVSVDPFGFTKTFSLQSEADAQWTIEIGVPCELLVDVIDSDTGERVPLRKLLWGVSAESVGSHPTPNQAEVSDRPEQCKLLVPPGYVVLTPIGSDFLPFPSSTKVTPEGDHPSKTEHVIHVQVPRCGVEVCISVDGDICPQLEPASVKIEPLGESAGASPLLRATANGWTSDYVLASPGTYRVTLEPPPGFEAPESQEVTVEARRRVRVEFELRRIQSEGGEAPSGTEAPGPRSEREALAFLSEKVDRTMYNIVAHGARDARARLVLVMPSGTGERVTATATVLWRNDPWALRFDIGSTSPSDATLSRWWNVWVKNRPHEYLLLPMSSLAPAHRVALTRDGELVKLTFMSREHRNVLGFPFSHWFTEEGKLVKSDTQPWSVRGPGGGGLYERTLLPAGDGESAFLVHSSALAPFAFGSATILNEYTDAGGVKVLRQMTDTRSYIDGDSHTVQMTFEIEINPNLDPALFEEK
ncbi:MAG: hypothetical protein AB1486_27830 [Planctomycetota bacterium]